MPNAAPVRPLARAGTLGVNLLSEAKSRPCPAGSLTSHDMRVTTSHSVIGSTDAGRQLSRLPVKQDDVRPTRGSRGCNSFSGDHFKIRAADFDLFA